ncbi:MAG: YceD family protein [Rhodobacterales bacterium]|nr:YceD family protein [Rhodobacterales bacterium]
MTDAPPPARPTRFRTGGLSPRKPTRFDYVPDAAERERLAQALGLLALRRLDLKGELAPNGRDELVMTARLVADGDQSCVVTLVPVRVRVDEDIRRRYVLGLKVPDGDEVEMPEDDEVEPLPEMIDLAEVAAEALALALPLYPRAPGAELGTVVHAATGIAAMTDDDLKPFAGLAALAGKLATPRDPEGDGGGGT